MSNTNSSKKVVLFLCSIFIFNSGHSQDNLKYSEYYLGLLYASLDSTNDFYYPKLLKRFESFDTTMRVSDIIALQVGYTGTESYDPYSLWPHELDVLNLVAQKDYTKALQKCDSILAINPVSLVALMEKWFSNMKLNSDSTKLHLWRYERIAYSNLWVGDGSIEYPYFVTSPGYGQVLISYFIGGEIESMGSASDSEGYFTDVIDVYYPDEAKSATLHFSIDHCQKIIRKEIEEILKKSP